MPQYLYFHWKILKKKQEHIQDLRRNYGDSSISKAKKTAQCNLCAVTMNQAIRDSWKKSEEAK